MLFLLFFVASVFTFYIFLFLYNTPVRDKK